MFKFVSLLKYERQMTVFGVDYSINLQNITKIQNILIILQMYFDAFKH